MSQNAAKPHLAVPGRAWPPLVVPGLPWSCLAVPGRACAENAPPLKLGPQNRSKSLKITSKSRCVSTCVWKRFSRDFRLQHGPKMGPTSTPRGSSKRSWSRLRFECRFSSIFHHFSKRQNLEMLILVEAKLRCLHFSRLCKELQLRNENGAKKEAKTHQKSTPRGFQAPLRTHVCF